VKHREREREREIIKKLPHKNRQEKLSQKEEARSEISVKRRTYRLKFVRKK